MPQGIVAPVTISAVRYRWLRRVVIVIGVLVAFGLHFRPWEVAFLEEWPLAEYWSDEGPLQFAAHYFEWSLSRPLHLVPTAIGLALSGGAPGGIFLVLGVVAGAQFLLVIWAVRPLSHSFWISAAVALFIALHPLWPGGFLQRFLPAQAAALAMIVAAGFIVRWLLQGRIRWIILAIITLLVGLCIYPGPAVAAPLLAVVLACAVPSSLRRRLAVILGVAGASAIMTLYSLVITPLISAGGDSYEAGNFAAATMASPRDVLSYLGTALIGKGLIILAGVLAVAVLGAVLALAGAVPHWAGWLMFGTALVSPLCATVFFGNVSWIQNIDRIGYATSLGLIAAVAVWPLTSGGRRPRVEVIVAAMMLVFSVLGALRGIQHWQPYIQLQHRLLEEIAPAVREARGEETVVVVDHSGTYGSEYPLPQYYINSASHVVNQDGSEVWLCYLETDKPLDGAAVCSPSDTGEDLRLVNRFTLPSGDVEIYIGQSSSDE